MYIKSQNNFASECAASLTLSLSLSCYLLANTRFKTTIKNDSTMDVSRLLVWI